MKKNTKNKTILGLSLLQAIILILVLTAIIIGIKFIYGNRKNIQKNIPAAIVITEEIVEPKLELNDSTDIIGDFILDHEYFAANRTKS